MRTRFVCSAALVAFALLVTAGGPEVEAQSSAPKVELKVLKYADLGKAIRALKGKVVVVDIWATSCLPCMREFPHLVEMHAKYAADGLVCLSVSMDDPTTPEKALKFLTTKKATFPNYLLEEGMEYAFDRWDIKSMPAVFVFQRDGRRAMKFTNEDDKTFGYEKDVEPLVRKLLAEKE